MKLNIHTVYIQMFDGTEVYRPVKASLDPKGFSQILPSDEYDPKDRTELWAFRPGDKVLVRKQEFGSDKTVGELAYAPFNESDRIKDLNWFLHSLLSNSLLLNKANIERFGDFINQVKADLAANIFHYPKIREAIENLS